MSPGHMYQISETSSRYDNIAWNCLLGLAEWRISSGYDLFRYWFYGFLLLAQYMNVKFNIDRF
jgi:hypothetical protein